MQPQSRFGPSIWTVLGRTAHRTIDVSLWIYVLGLMAWFVVRESMGDAVLPVLVLSYLGTWLFLPLLFFGLWVVMAQRRLAVLLFFPVWMLLHFYGSSFLPRFKIEDEPIDPIAVLSFNLRSDNMDTASIVDVVLSSRTEVLALQEVSTKHRVDLENALAGTHPHSSYLPSSGLAIFSARPISVQDALQEEGWPVQGVIVQSMHSSFYLVNAHLSRVGILGYLGRSDAPPLVESAVRRGMQVARIQKAIHEVGLPAIVACDCNMTDLTAAYSALTGTLEDAHRERGWGFGYTYLVPRGLDIPSGLNVAVQRIDYLLYSPDIQVRSFKVIHAATGSDHLPIMAQFDLGVGQNGVP